MALSRVEEKKNTYSLLLNNQEIIDLKNENMELRNQLERYQKQMKVANDQLLVLKQRYTSLISELSMKEQAAEEISRIALREANQIIEKAKGNADLIVKEAMTSAKGVYIEINKLTKETKTMRTDIKDKLVSMNDLIDSFVIPVVPNIDYLSKEDEKK